MKMFDTHCHLNFKTFAGKESGTIENAARSGVDKLVVPGTDLENSAKAVELAQKYEGVYAAVGIHPHHLFENVKSGTLNLKTETREIEKLLMEPKVVAVGEVGIDRHYYRKTKYLDYQVNESFIETQKLYFLEQLKLAVKHQKTLIVHNREAKKDSLEILNSNLQLLRSIPVVFHCCEPDKELLKFAREQRIYVGIDGDVTYWKNKQDVVNQIPLDRLVLETDSPFLQPEPLRSRDSAKPKDQRAVNEPKNIVLILNYLAEKLNLDSQELARLTTENSRKLFQLKSAAGN